MLWISHILGASRYTDRMPYVERERERETRTDHIFTGYTWFKIRFEVL